MIGAAIFLVPVIAAIAVICALAYWAVCTRKDHRAVDTALKTGSTALLAVAGLLAGAPLLVVLGLALGSLGDLLLSRPGQPAFLGGMAAFATGHLAYLIHFLLFAQNLPPLPAALMLVLALSTEYWLIPHTGALRYPVRGYVAIITAMAMGAMAMAPGHGWMQLGAGLFVLSDLLLAVTIFIAPRAWLERLLWPVYWLAQAFIMFGALA